MNNELNPHVTLFVFVLAITLIGLNRQEYYPLTKYEKAIKNRNKIRNKQLKKDIKTIKREINLMIKKGKITSIFQYKANEDFFEYIEECGLFIDCKISRSEIFANCIEIEILKN